MAMGQSTQFCLAEGHGTCMEGVRLTSPLDGSKSVGDIVSLTMIQVISKAVYETCGDTELHRIPISFPRLRLCWFIFL